jgi:protein-tyrosine phosphatase
MAQGLLMQRMAELGIGRRVHVDSAGINVGMPGQRPDPRAEAQLKKRGVKLPRCRSRALEHRDFDRFDYILGMDHGHMEWLREQASAGAGAQIAAILEFATLCDEIDVPDPYFEKTASFARVLDLLQSGVDGFVADVLEPELRARGVI